MLAPLNVMAFKISLLMGALPSCNEVMTISVKAVSPLWATFQLSLLQFSLSEKTAVLIELVL